MSENLFACVQSAEELYIIKYSNLNKFLILAK